MLVPVGDWVLREAADQARRWPRSTTGPASVSPSTSRRSRCTEPGFPDDVRAAIAHAGIEPSQLILELTESTLMDAQVARTAKRLHDLGVRLAIDDFGTGYSSMSYLKRFAVDEVKIDRTFVDGLGHDPDDATIVGAIVNMTHTLGLVTIAEGVETTMQRDALHRAGLRARARLPLRASRIARGHRPHAGRGRRLTTNLRQLRGYTSVDASCVGSRSRSRSASASASTSSSGTRVQINTPSIRPGTTTPASLSP